MTIVTRWIKTTTHLLSILSMIFLTMGAAGLRHTSWPVFRVALQREGRIDMRWEVHLGVGVGASARWVVMMRTATEVTLTWLRFGRSGGRGTSPSRSGCSWGESPARSTGTGSAVRWPRAPLREGQSGLGAVLTGTHPPPSRPGDPGLTCCAPAGGHQEQEQHRCAEEPGGGVRGWGHGCLLGGSVSAAGRLAGALAERAVWLPEPSEPLLSWSEGSC